MTLPVPVERTWVVGDIVTAAMMNSNLRDGVGFLANPPLASMFAASSQSIPNGSTTVINLDAESADTYNGHSTTTNNNRYTAQVAGWYAVFGQIGYPSNATGRREAFIQVNAGAVSAFEVATNTNQQTLLQVSDAVFLNAADWVGLATFQTSGVALSLQTGASVASSMLVYWIHA